MVTKVKSRAVSGLALPTIWEVFGTEGHDIMYAMTEIPSFRKIVFIPSAGCVLLSYNLDFMHRGISAGAPYGDQYPVGLAARVRYRNADTEAGLTGSFLDVPNSTGAGQVLGASHHYTTVPRARVPFNVLGNKWYQFTMAATAHTDAGTMDGVNGACELTIGGGKQHLIIEYQPGISIS